jgi:hypothetical protein
MADIMRSKSVTVKMTPRQAAEAERALTRAAFGTESGRLYSAATAIRVGLLEAGWDIDEKGNWTHG